MKITKRQLKRIIKEEKAKLLKENFRRQEEDASFALQALLDSYMETWGVFDDSVAEIQDFFQGWLDNILDEEAQRVNR